MGEIQEKILAYDNQFHEFGTQTVEGVECVTTPFPVIVESGNLVNLELSQTELRELLSSIQVGAEWAYPDKSHQILFNFMKGLICSPQNPESGCIRYLPSAPFIKFFPDNPYIANDKSAGWNKEAWFVFPTFDTLFPNWIDNWLNGAITSLTNYEPTDVLFNLESLPINPIDAFLNGGGVLPKIEIRFSGSGELDITLLSFPLGGKAVIELDNEPNVLDILTGGIIDPNSFIVELNRDILNFPPDEYPIVQFPMTVETGGEHVLYICFIPTLDDSLLPIGFGGGFRSVELCGFSQEGNMGIEQIVWDGCQLKSITSGVETVIVTAEQIEACLDIPSGGGGGGGGSLEITNYELRPANATTSSTTFVDATGWNIQHAFTKSKAYIDVRMYGNGGSASVGTFRLTLDSQASDDAIEVELQSATAHQFNVCGIWTNLTASTKTLQVQFKTNNNAILISTLSSMVVTIIEFDDVSALFVEDIRIFEGELQKKIGGVWVAVTDSFESIIASLQSQVSAAAANAAAAVSTANNALSIAQGAVNVNNAQNIRLNDLEMFQEDAELSLSQLSLSVNDHEARIDALEASSGGSSEYFTGGVWSENYTWSDAGINGVPPFSITDGVAASLGVASNFSPSPNKAGVVFSPVRNNQITHVGIKLIRLGHTNPMLINVDINGITTNGFYATFDQDVAAAGEHIIWLRVPNLVSDGIIITAESQNSDRFYLRGLILLGRGLNPFI